MKAQYDLSKLQELLRDFYSLTGIKICIYDREENELCYYPEKLTGFCRQLRANTVLEARCRACDRRGFSECKKTSRRHAYTCHAGLLECMSPILHDGDIIGYIAIGQCRTAGSPPIPDIGDFPDGEEKAQIFSEYEKLPEIPMEKIKASIRIMDACAGYEYLRGLMDTQDTQIDRRLAKYISDNLAEPLSVRFLCSQFHLSHNEMYAIFKEYFDSTPAAYIKSQRLLSACRLLTQTRLPVNEVARKCGIPDYNYFTKQFKSGIGVTPSEYRKNGNKKRGDPF